MVQECIGRQILEHFAALAQRAIPQTETDTGQDPAADDARLRIQSVLDQVHIMIKGALVAQTAPRIFTWDDKYLTALSALPAVPQQQ